MDYVTYYKILIIYIYVYIMVNCYYNHGLNYGNITKEQPTNQCNMFVRTDLNNNNHQPIFHI